MNYKGNETDEDILKKLLYLFISLFMMVVLTFGIAFILSFQ